MSTRAKFSKPRNPKISLHTDLKVLFGLFLLGIASTSAAVTMALQPAWVGPAQNVAATDGPQAWNARTFTHAGLRLNMSEQQLFERFPKAKAVDALGGVRVITFETEDATRYFVWFHEGGSAHRIKTTRIHSAANEREIVSALHHAFGDPAAGDCAGSSSTAGGCSFSWWSREGWLIEAAWKPTDRDPGRMRMSVTFTDTYLAQM